jgi:preprotein translocase subunit SecG
MFTFLLVVQAIIAAMLVTVILMQRSEGGGLGVGGSPSGFMSARGAADFLTRSTTILASLFVGLSIVLAVIASVQHAPSTIDTSLVKGAAPLAPAGNAPPVAGGDPLSGAAQSVGNGAAPAAEKTGNQSVPLAN